MEISVGLGISPAVGGQLHPVEAAVTAERLGFDFVSINDHLHGSGARFETWTLLTWIGASTSRVEIASRVLAVPYRNPAVLAKMAESLDRLSRGRLILGLGSGAVEDEFAAFGLGRTSPGARIEGLEEAILIARGLWHERSHSFVGRHYHTERAQIEPKSERHIPIWLGMYRPRGLALVGRLGDGWIPTLELAPPEKIPGMRAVIDAAAHDAGRDAAELRFVYNLDVSLAREADLPRHVVRGTAVDVTKQLAGFVALGFGAFNMIVVGPNAERQADQLAGEVLPAVRAMTDGGA